MSAFGPILPKPAGKPQTAWLARRAFGVGRARRKKARGRDRRPLSRPIFCRKPRLASIGPLCSFCRPPRRIRTLFGAFAPLRLRSPRSRQTVADGLRAFPFVWLGGRDLGEKFPGSNAKLESLRLRGEDGAKVFLILTAQFESPPFRNRSFLVGARKRRPSGLRRRRCGVKPNRRRTGAAQGRKKADSILCLPVCLARFQASSAIGRCGAKKSPTCLAGDRVSCRDRGRMSVDAFRAETGRFRQTPRS